MNQELKTFVVNMKSLNQTIDNPIVQGGGDANGRTLRIIFTQEAFEQFTPETNVYLKWHHEQLNIRGYNIFTHVQGEGIDCQDYPVWEIHFPKAMLHEGDVTCCIEIVDDISIAPSTNFTVHVLKDPDDGSNFVVSDDYSIFQQAVIDLNSFLDSAQEKFKTITDTFAGMEEKIDSAYISATEALEKANEALDKIEEKSTADGVFLIEI